MTPVVAGLPELGWVAQSGTAVHAEDTLVLRAPPSSDWFCDPAGPTRVRSAPALCFPRPGQGQLVARVQVGFGATFDAGVLFVHQGDADFAKLCLELSPTGRPTVVSVVTREVSDDANGPEVEGDEVWLRVSFVGEAVAFHHSLDGQRWDLTRLFALRSPAAPTSIGFLAQSPTGPGCEVAFADVAWHERVLEDVRDGT